MAALQVKAETCMGSTKVMEAVCEAPFRLAVTPTVWPDVMFPVVAVKLLEVVPDATATETGTVSCELLSVTVALTPAGGAA